MMGSNSSYSDNWFDLDSIRFSLAKRVNRKLDKYKSRVGYYYHLRIWLHINSDSAFRLEDLLLMEVGRKLVNGQNSFGGISNRVFFNKHFIGGVRVKSLFRNSRTGLQSYCLNFILYSNSSNVHIDYLRNIQTRIKLINHNAVSDISFIGAELDIDAFLKKVLELTDIKIDDICVDDEKKILKILRQQPFFIGRFHGGSN